MKAGDGIGSIWPTPEGGLAIKFVNKTGAASVKGTLLEAGTVVDDSVQVVGIDDPDCIGVIYEDGIADGELVWVVTHGKADVLLEDTTASTRGYWCSVSAVQQGRANITLAAPPGGTINAIDAHFREIGHCVQSVTAGTDKLARVIMHFN